MDIEEARHRKRLWDSVAKQVLREIPTEEFLEVEEIYNILAEKYRKYIKKRYDICLKMEGK